MRKLIVWLMAVAAIFIAVPESSAQPTGGTAPVGGIVRVKLQPEVARKVGRQTRLRSKGQLATGMSVFDRTMSDIKAVSLRPMLPPDSPHAARHAKYGLDRWYVVTFDETVTPEEARRQLAATPGIEISETVRPMSLKEGDGAFTAVTTPQLQAAGSYPFNDPQLPMQWHYKNYGNLAGTVAGADINLFDAWNITTGRSGVVVAIIDGGIDYRHEDLAANMWVNTAELNGTPGVDDDGNGYVDDIYGYNFCTNSGEVYPHSHGTHVAGTVGAVNNNGLGVSGVAGGDGTPGSGVRLMSVQVFDSRSGSGDADFAAAIVYACDMGATIAQCSWGWDADGYYEQAVLDAIDYFTAEAKSDNMTGGLCIFAGGNAGLTGDFYPAAYDKVVGVAAMTNSLQPASYSNNGPWVDVTAPGGLLDYGEAGGVLSTLPNNQYGYNEGTSMATPHVSGIAALILSKYGSPTFVNESLRTQLVTSVNDLYGYGNNEIYRGNFGSGYIDATKALTMGDGAAPESVDDFSLAAAQDYISVSWTIPASGDNNVHHHIVYYSTEPFDASSDLSKLQTTIADTKFLSSGDSFTQEIGNLRPLTTYYVAIKAMNRWGAASGLSPVKSVTTNAGPQMTVDRTEVSMQSTASEPRAKAEFNIGNDADGILKWEAGKRTASVRPASVPRPNIGRVVPYNGTTGADRITTHSRVADDYSASDYPKDIIYFSELWLNIGDSDKSLPNSMAQWFYVDPEQYPDGFNLTEVKIEGANGSNPVIQIYKGDVAITTASLLQTVDYPYFVYGYPIALNEQLYFAPGDAFWVAVHFEGNQEGYPLGVGRSSVANAPAYSYMSNDMGKTWSTLATALAGSPYESYASELTWAITARSSNPDWSSIVELNPTSGTVLRGEQQKVEVSADGSKLVNGDYRFNITLTNNQTDNNTMVIPVEYNVSGNTPDVVVPKIVDFGSLLIGQEKTLTVEVYNQGYGKFAGSQWSAGIYSDKIESTSPHFRAPDYVASGFPARTRTSFEVTYAPQSAGSHTGNIIFTDMDGRQVRLVTQGVATEPARLDLEPAVVEAGTITLGAEPVTAAFRIANQGKYPLEYVFPKFSGETISGETARYHKYGYTVASTIGGFDKFEYDGNPALIGGTDISAGFTDADYISKPVSLGFSFPFYGKNYDKVYITSFGGLMFNPTESMLRSPLTETSTALAGTGIISAYGSQLMMSPASRVEYAKADGKFVVRFTDVLAVVYDKDYIPVSFHITLSSNGDIEIFYDDYDPMSVFQSGSTLYCGINDPEMADHLTLTSADMADYWGNEQPTPDNTRFREFGTGTSVRFEAPKPLFVTSLNSPAGIVNPGESVEITASISVNDSMDAGETFNNLAILTNDPSPAYSAVRINATVSGEGLNAVAALENTEINVGDVFRTADIKVPVTVKNTGHNSMDVTAVSLANGKMQVSAELPFTLKPGLAKDIVVTVPTDREGAVADVLTVRTTAGNLSADISANVIGCPGAVLSLDEVNETILSGTPLSKELTVTNDGNETLLYSIVADPSTRLTLPANDKASTSYQYTFSGDDASTTYEWVDIETNGLGIQNPMSYYNLHDYVEVELPFEFPFYGKKYDRMYIYNTGFVSFTKREDARIWPEPPADFPQGSIYTNIIAPYWGLHSMDQTKTAGTFHYVTDDRAVVSFMEYGNSMNIGVCFQLIMEKDGSFRFQYKAADEFATIFNIFGLAGITNLEGDNYIRLPERMVTFNSAVAFRPVVQSPVAPGKSETVTIGFDTDRMAGNYQSELTVNTNVPAREKITIPVSLDITGEAQPVFPDDITVEHVIGYQDTDYSKPLVQMGAMYEVPFEVRNTGSALFTIDAIEVGGPTYFDDWFGEEVNLFNLFVNAPETDWITGEPTGRSQWQMYYGDILSVGRQPLQFSLPMLEPSLAMTTGTYDVPLTFHYTTEKGQETRTVNIRFDVTPAPAMTFDRDEIVVKADDDLSAIVESLHIGNEGEYRLDYSLRLDPTGAGEQPAEGGEGGIAPWSTADAAEITLTDLAAGKLRGKLRAGREGGSALDVPSDFEYTDALYYPAIAGTSAVYNYGSQTEYDLFKEAVAFKAPADGFNISHIYLPVTIGTATNYHVGIEVIQGSNPAEGSVLGRGALTIESQANPAEGKFFVVPLEKSAYINPDEEFTVVVSYPAGCAMPSFLVAKEEAVVADRYFAWTEAFGWYDVGQLFKENYGSLGYILTCLETKEGEPWIRLLGSEGDSSVAVGGKAEVKIAINPESARMEGENKAVLVIKSNDPNQPLVNFPVILQCNSRPVIDAPASVVYAKEGETTVVDIAVSDPDGDDFVIDFESTGPARLADVIAAEGDSPAVSSTDGGWTVSGATMPVIARVEIAADYGTGVAGNVFRITATDSGDLTESATVRYDVQHVNRAPEAAEPLKLDVAVGSTTGIVEFSSLFDDPDGDDMTYEFEMGANRFASAFTTDYGVIFSGDMRGQASAFVTATDTYGAKARAEIIVNVGSSGISDVNAEADGRLSVMPNPVADELNAHCGFDAGEAQFTLYSTAGRVMASATAAVHAGQTVTIPVHNVAPGYYLLTVKYDDTLLSTVVIKK